ncbi:circularly permuted type 2 ATP-grasp protein [Paenibacillus hodogayensis]|uniref:Circularly permuted type 2 ATP-grasp protein n=1 Tax=Paenibacillus hodogayensis TaxID=279208 RepID=A0ABV5W462_9BACL
MHMLYETGSFYDEMLEPCGTPKTHYETVYRALHQLPADELRRKHETAQNRFLRQGVTFTVYNDNAGAERTMPFDPIPIIVPSAQWARIEQGMIQRVSALNCFLEDVYGEQFIVRDGIIPEKLVLDNPAYRPEVAGHSCAPRNSRIFLAGIDLIRDDFGEYRVLEDNLRNPSGIAYVYENRNVMRHVFPELFRSQQIMSIEHQFGVLHETMLNHAPAGFRGPGLPRAVLLTPGPYNSAYYDHAFLARQMGIELVEGGDLAVLDGYVYERTIRGLQRVDIIYRRIDDDFLDPLAFRPDSMIGVPGLFDAHCRGNVSILNGLGNGIADHKGVYAYVPDMIRYYLNEEPIIPNVPTLLLNDPEQREYVFERMDRLVIKNVGASGGYDMLIGPHATEEEIVLFREKMMANPEQYIAQPTVKLSRAPTLHQHDDRVYPCHIDLRVFAMRGGDHTHVLPGGLSRVALKEGSLVVNSSQGGGGKDTWVLQERGGLVC